MAKESSGALQAHEILAFRLLGFVQEVPLLLCVLMLANILCCLTSRSQ